MPILSFLVVLAACETATTPSSAPGSAPDGQPATPAAGETRTLTLAGYTTPREAYGEAIIPAFQAEWKKKTGQEVKFEASYQGSGAQARAVKEGLEADVVALSLDPDVQVLQDAGLITADWRAAANGGIVTRSVAVIAVRPGNPKGIHDWSDLAKPGIEVLTPNAKTSGGAMWNVLAIWGAAMGGNAGVAKDDKAGAEKLLGGILKNVKVMDKGARESIVTFEKGVGDAAITYENEVLVAKQEGEQMDYVVPPSTILIENPIAVVDTYAKKHGNEDLANAFVVFCMTREAQEAYAKFGLRPVLEDAVPKDLPVVEHLFTIQDLGGWPVAKKEVFAEGGAYDLAMGTGK
jgi:sulfate/thiosulfate transport system substrate-binding protein